MIAIRGPPTDDIWGNLEAKPPLSGKIGISGL
jgi:hypothetical protein